MTPRSTTTTPRSLAAARPDLAAQWHSTKNHGLHPGHVPSGSRRPAWWTCPNGHDYQCVVALREQGHTCPTCGH